MMHGQAGQSNMESRYGWLDIARGLAVIAMTVFHFAWDLEFFGYVPHGMTSEPGWRWFARGIATAFLLLAGYSFVLAHRNGLRPRPFIKRLAQICAAATLISVSTWFATPERFVFFGILHQIAFATILGAILLRLPWFVLAVLAAGIVIVNATWTSEIFSNHALWWVGLAPHDPPTNDYVPVFPWTAHFIAGMVLARLFPGSSTAATAGPASPASPPVKVLQFLGRHSLIYYLVHQPVMIALMSGFAFLFPPQPGDPTPGFFTNCIGGCLPGGYNEAYCSLFCTCVADDLKARGIFVSVANGKIATGDSRVNEAAQMCTLKANEAEGG